MNAREIATTLEELGIDKESHRALGLLPLVYVAWADGKMQRAERGAILKVARDKGWLAGNGAAILERWLDEPPSAEYVRKGLALLAALAQQDRGVGAHTVKVDTLRHLVAYCRDVAAAAGGAFGLSDPVSEEEADALATIARAFAIEGGKTWRELAAEADEHEHRLPPGPRGHFLLGNLPDMISDPLGTLMRAREHGDVAWIRMPGLPMALVWRPEHVEHVLVDHKDNYLRGQDYEMLARVVGKSLLTTDGDTWRKLRRISQPAFHAKKLAGMADVIVERTDRMLDRWEAARSSGQILDVADEMMRVTLEIIGLLAFSTDLGDASSSLGEAVNIALHHAMALMNNPIRLPQSFPTPDNRRFARALAVFDELIYGKITERRRMAAAEHPNDLLTLVMAARDEETGEALNDEQLRNELLTMLLAGHETTALALTWTFYLLSKHPTVARQVRAEIVEILGNERPTLESAKKLSYTKLVVDEAMRLYPPAPLVGRTAVAEDEIGGYRIPKGTDIFVSPWVTHHSPEIWPNPEGFDPERFRPEAAASHHRCAYFPFAAGPHKCIGAPLAMMELYLMLPRILLRYRLDLVPGFEPGLDPAITLRPRHGMKMTVHAAGP